MLVEKEFLIKIDHKVGQEIEVDREGGNATIDFTCKLLVEIQDRLGAYLQELPTVNEMVSGSTSRLVG